MAKIRSGMNLYKPISVGIFVIMVVSIILLRFLDLGDDQKAKEQAPDLDAILEKVWPDDSSLEDDLRPALGAEPLRSEEMGFLSRDSEPIRALVSKPSGEGPFSTVIIVHDGEGSERTTDRVATLLGQKIAEEGVLLTVTVDWREGEVGTKDLTDVISAVDWVYSLREADSQPIFLFGVGHGAYLSLLALQDVKVNGVISAYGYIDPSEEYEYLKQNNENSAEVFLKQTGCDQEAHIESCLQNLSLVDTLVVNIPVLLLHGTNDSFVPLAQSEQMSSIAPQELATVLTLEGAGYGFLSDSAAVGYDEGWSTIYQWIDTIAETVKSQNTVLREEGAVEGAESTQTEVLEEAVQSSDAQEEVEEESMKDEENANTSSEQEEREAAVNEIRDEDEVSASEANDEEDTPVVQVIGPNNPYTDNEESVESSTEE